MAMTSLAKVAPAGNNVLRCSALYYVVVLTALVVLGTGRALHSWPGERSAPIIGSTAKVQQPHVLLEVADGRSISPLAQRWDDCSSGVYVDVGTNVAVQIRKLYDPDKFPGAKIHPLFDAYFGRERSKVCSVGFEPNSAHVPYLESLNDHFQQRGLPGYVFTGVAASSHRGSMSFYTDARSPQDKHEWAASLAAWHRNESGPTITVQLVDLQNFMMDFVIPLVTAQRARSGKRVPIVMKMDIEGAEFSVLPAMIVSGALCQIDLIYIEWHEYLRGRMPDKFNMTRDAMLEAFEAMRRMHPRCNVAFSALDDETYVDGTAVPL